MPSAIIVIILPYIHLKYNVVHLFHIDFGLSYLKYWYWYYVTYHFVRTI